MLTAKIEMWYRQQSMQSDSSNKHDEMSLFIFVFNCVASGASLDISGYLSCDS